MEQELVIPDESVINRIYIIRGQKEMLASDLAEMYGMETRVLNQAVKRNEARFPPDFMFELTEEEYQMLKDQNIIPSHGGRRRPPNVFTEHGVLMLSSVLRSDKAVAINIQIVRIFTGMRDLLTANKDLEKDVADMKLTVANQEEKIDSVMDYLIQYVNQEAEPRKEIGYKTK